MNKIFIFFLTINLTVVNAQLKSVSISADKMNVFYVGIDNPVTIAVAGINSNDIEVSVSGLEGASISGENARYIVRASQQTGYNQFCSVTVKDKKSGKICGSYPFRVKIIPEPQARLTNNKSDANISAGEMKAQNGIMAVLENFDFEAKCQISSYEIMYIAKGQEPLTNVNSGGAFSLQSKKLIESAQSGDVYIFKEVNGNCPGDTSPRKLNPIVISIR
jgi:hypothetical protein